MQGNAIRRILLVLGGTALAVVTLTLIVPKGQSTLGVTFCYPLYGPLQRFNPTLSDSLLARVRAHEEAHADQCRRDGVLWYTIRRLAPRQRLLSEAEGYCAEVGFGVTHGGPARLLYASALDELRERRWFHRFSTTTLIDALASQCPTIAARATPALLSRATTFAGMLVAAGLCGCDLTGASERFVIRVDRIEAPLVVAPADTLRVRFFGGVGPSGCWWLEAVDRHLGPGTLDVRFHGAHADRDGHDCTQAPVVLSHEEVIPPPLQLPFTVTVHQPDGTLLQRRITAPLAAVTLLVTNATCGTGQCLPLEIGGIVPKFAVPGQPPGVLSSWAA